MDNISLNKKVNNLNLRRIGIPALTVTVIFFLWFGPLHMPYIVNIVISLLIVVANYFEYHGKPFSALGFQRKRFTVINLLVLAPLVASALFAFYVFLLVPGVTLLTGVPIDYSAFAPLEGDLGFTLVAIAVVWATAGFGEEIIFRGYFMRQFAKFFGEGKISIALNIIVLGCFFGFMHGYQGITGQVVTGVIGAIIAFIFYLRKYDLWFVIAVHGFIDTIALLCLYFGLA